MATIVQQTNGEKTIYTADEYKLVQQQLATMNNNIGANASQLADIGQYASSYKTSSNTWSQAIQACINYCVANNYKKIILPPKTDMVIDTTLTNTGGTTGAWDLIFEGGGIGVDGRGTCLTFNGNGYLFTNDLTNPTSGSWRGITFKNMSLRTTNPSPTTSNGIKLIYTQQAYFEKVEFVGFNRNVTITGNSHYPHFKDCKWTGATGVFVPDTSDPDYVVGGANNGLIENGFFTYCDTNPINQSPEGSGWLIKNTDFEGENGAVVISSENRLENVRLERNKNAQQWLTITGDKNYVQMNIGADGAHQPTPLMQVDGDFNEFDIKGGALYIVDSTSTGHYNNFKITDYRPILSTDIINGLPKPNYLSTIVKDDINLVNPDLTKWTVNNMTVASSTFSDGSPCYLLTTTNSSGTSWNISYTINQAFKKGDIVYVRYDYEDVAGGGWSMYLGSDSYGVADFDQRGATNTHLFGYYVNADVSSLTIKLDTYLGSGLAMKFNNVRLSKILANNFVS